MKLDNVLFFEAGSESYNNFVQVQDGLRAKINHLVVERYDTYDQPSRQGIRVYGWIQGMGRVSTCVVADRVGESPDLVKVLARMFDLMQRISIQNLLNFLEVFSRQSLS